MNNQRGRTPQDVYSKGQTLMKDFKIEHLI